MVRAKFRLAEVTSFGNTGMQKFKFSAVQDTSIPEDAQFTKYTPSGTLEMSVDNPPAQAQFKVGDYYYLDFTPCAEQK